MATFCISYTNRAKRKIHLYGANRCSRCPTRQGRKDRYFFHRRVYAIRCTSIGNPPLDRKSMLKMKISKRQLEATKKKKDKQAAERAASWRRTGRERPTLNAVGPNRLTNRHSSGDSPKRPRRSTHQEGQRKTNYINLVGGYPPSADSSPVGDR
ncbi:hypothetical protein FNV43_RR17312 [Rhamnella rubrinervis]|uniref:Uncharacterized protein n=1 Tax=Rhamnella rubrinervis TaxID=2594499 RepID=A0A8K0DWV5_9ROSA|nr:hypothetical protein FNV43_RR17312 [Rhamnella rubrinervis]